jgi:UDP-N-acetylmuramate--alanine ligase
MNHVSDLDLTRLLTSERHKIHLIGVAGAGMSGIAALLLELGHQVSGSDKLSTLETERLQQSNHAWRPRFRDASR